MIPAIYVHANTEVKEVVVMKYNPKRVLVPCFLVISLIFLSGILVVNAATDSPHRVFILHSYEDQHVCGQPQHDGIVAALKKVGFKENENLKIQTYHMDMDDYITKPIKRELVFKVLKKWGLNKKVAA